MIGPVGAGLTERVGPHDTSGPGGAQLVGPCWPTLIKSADFFYNRAVFGLIGKVFGSKLY